MAAEREEGPADRWQRGGSGAAAQSTFYQGFVAEAIDNFVRQNDVLDATGRKHRGLLTASDLASWQPQVEEPVSLTYRGYTVHKPGPCSKASIWAR